MTVRMNRSILIAGALIAVSVLAQPVISQYVRQHLEDQEELKLLCAKHKARYRMSELELEKVGYGRNCNGTGWNGE